jgi:exodeoxyribonuclease VII small subunit
MGSRKKISYSEAIAELEEIVRGIESEAIDLDHLTERVKRARYLINFCQSRLRSTEEGVKKVLAELETEEEAGPGPEAGTSEREPQDPGEELF